MKLNENFVLRQVADLWVVLPLAEKTVDFSALISLNETGAMLWKLLEEKNDCQALVDALTTEYDVSEAQAQSDVEQFLQKLADAGCLD